MLAAEFQAKVIAGKIEIPERFRAQFQGEVNVILFAEGAAREESVWPEQTRRRWELIAKMVRQGLTAEETQELAALQQRADEQLAQAGPRPSSSWNACTPSSARRVDGAKVQPAGRRLASSAKKPVVSHWWENPMKSSFFALAHLTLGLALCGCSAETKPGAIAESRDDPDPTKRENATAPGEKRKGIDPDDPSIVYDEPFQMVTGKKTYNGKAYERTSLWIDQKTKLVLPDKHTEVVRPDNGSDVVVFLEKWFDHASHGDTSWPITKERARLGCAVKLEKGELLIGTFGEYRYKEGAVGIRLVVHVPGKVAVSRRAGLAGGMDGWSGSEKPKSILTKKKEGRSESWLPPTAEDGWHEIPVIPDSEHRARRE